MSDQPLSFPVPVAQIPAGGKHLHLEADAVQRRAIAEALEIVDVTTLAAEVDVRPVGAGAFSVRGTLNASVVQTDVVTVEPVRQEVSEEIDLTLVPAEESASPSRPAGVDIDEEATDERDVYHGGRIDLGEIVYEHLAVGLDPYPRSPGVEFSGHVEDNEDATKSPFAALAALKPDRK